MLRWLFLLFSIVWSSLLSIILAGSVYDMKNDKWDLSASGGTYPGGLAVHKNNSLHLIIKDHLTNMRAVVDVNSGCSGPTYQAQYDFYPYGKILRKVEAPRSRFQSTDHETDLETGYNNRNARWYDDESFQFLQIDPLATKFSSWSPYHYVNCNPIRFNDPTGMDTALFGLNSGVQIDNKESNSEKTPIWVVDETSKDYDSKNPWRTASPLTYEVGRSSESGGITGRSFRANHPLLNVGTRAGSQVYKEDLLDLSVEFRNLVKNGLNDFNGLNNKFFSNTQFRNLVTDNAKYDLKSLVITDGTPSYAAIVIGEWSLLFGTLRRYDDYGNISYGAFGLNGGFSKEKLLDGSNTNQLFKDWFGSTRGNGDESRDIMTIKMGFRLYEKGFFNIK